MKVRKLQRGRQILLLASTLPLLAWLLVAQEPRNFPVPVWPEDGKIPAELEGQYVFMTREQDALMVVLPESPGGDMRGPKKAVHISLHNQQIPSVTFSIKELPPSEWSFTLPSLSGPRKGTPPLDFPSLVQLETDGKYLYQYAVWNGEAAKDTIGLWSLVLAPETAARLIHKSVGEHEPWLSSWLAVSRSLTPWRQVELPGTPNGASAYWMVRAASVRVAPGESLGGFEVQSDRKPGFTTAYFSVSTRDDENVLDVEALPQEVSDQLGLLYDLHLRNRTTLTLGPMFAPDAPRAEIVANFRAGIARLIEKEWLDPQSPFTSEIQQASQKALRPGAQAVIIHSQPINELEAEIMQALRISLGFRFPSAEKQ